MNDNDFDLTARAWLDDGPTRLSDHALLSALEEIHTTRQRRAVWPAWRATLVSIFARMAIAAVLVVAVGLLASNVVPRQPDNSSVGGMSPSPSPAESVDFPNLTATFVSPTNGFSFKYHDRGGLAPATDLWDPVNDNQANDGFDAVETGFAAYFMAASTPIPDGVSIDEWVDEYVSPGGWLQHPGRCGGPRSQQAEITIDGQSGRISECANRIEATVVAGGRLYLFTLLHSRSDARAVFDAWIATIHLRPEAAALPSISPSS
jgi:hypothetical protein